MRPYNPPTFSTLIGEDMGKAPKTSRNKNETNKKKNRFSLRNLKFLSPTSSAMIPPLGTESGFHKKTIIVPKQEKKRPKSQVVVFKNHKSGGKNSSNSQSGSSGDKQQQLVMINELLQLEKQEDNYKLHNTFEILKRNTIKNLWQVDPHTFN